MTKPHDETATPVAAVIIPTHNRAASLRRVLRALASQTFDMRRVAVIVVADGCQDETVSMLENEDFGLRLTAIDQPQSGVAMTRN
jgi:glycosyltransferase involved in cell wall biosynthesis